MGIALVIEDLKSISHSVSLAIKKDSPSEVIEVAETMSDLDGLLIDRLPNVVFINLHFSRHRFEHGGIEAFAKVKSQECARRITSNLEITPTIFWGVEEEEYFWQNLIRRSGEPAELVQSYSGCSYLKLPITAENIIEANTGAGLWRHEICANKHYARYCDVSNTFAKAPLERKLAHLKHELLKFSKNIKSFTADEIERNIRDFVLIESSGLPQLGSHLPEVKRLILANDALSETYLRLQVNCPGLLANPDLRN
jgi:hypothetical protein